MILLVLKLINLPEMPLLTSPTTPAMEYCFPPSSRSACTRLRV
jgi:hypothetical protein